MARESSPVIFGIRTQSPQLPASGTVPPAWPWLRTFSNPTEHQKMLNLVKGEGAENNWRFPAAFAHLVSSLHLCRHSFQLPLSSILPFQFPTLAKPPAQQGLPDSDITLILPQGGSWWGCPPASPKRSFVLYRIILRGGDKNLLIPMEIEPCSSHTSPNSILHCVNRPAKALFFFLLEKFTAEGYSGQRGSWGA